MDFCEDKRNYDENANKANRTVWVGNLHPKVTHNVLAELFYQVGPIEYVELPLDKFENSALVVFKYSCSVDESIYLFRGTKLYGMPIRTKKYSTHIENSVFEDELNYFKQLMAVERNNQINSNRRRWDNQNLINSNNIPDSLPQPPIHNINTNRDNYDCRSDTFSEESSMENSSRYQHDNSFTGSRNRINKNNCIPFDKPYHQAFQNTKYNSNFDSMEVSNIKQDSNYNQNNDSDYLNGTDDNAACSSLSEYRDSMHHSKKRKFENSGLNYESKFNNQWSDRHNNISNGNRFSSKKSFQNNYTSKRFNGSNSKYTNCNTERNNYNSVFNQDESHRNFQNDNYRQEKNGSNNYGSYHRNPKPTESSSRQPNSYQKHNNPKNIYK